MQDFNSISTEALDTITGGGSGACEDGPKPYGTPRDGAAQMGGAVWADTDKFPTDAQMKGIQNSLKLGRNWSSVCARVREERLGRPWVP